MDPFLSTVLFSVLTDVITAGRLIDSPHFTRDRPDWAVVPPGLNAYETLPD